MRMYHYAGGLSDGRGTVLTIELGQRKRDNLPSWVEAYIYKGRRGVVSAAGC